MAFGVVRNCLREGLSLLAGFAGLLSAHQSDPLPLTCPTGMVKASEGVCIDEFEFPNVEGVRPWVALSAVGPHSLQEECSRKGKRLCTEQEWLAACEYDSEPSCNTEQPWLQPNEGKVARRDQAELRRLYQATPSGAVDCTSRSGAKDMLGNVEEWVTCDRSEDGFCLMGRYWSERRSCSSTVRNHSGLWHYYQSGGRCCADMETNNE